MPADRSAPEHAVDTLEGERARFRSVRKGYDPDEVDAYVRALQVERDSLAADLTAARERNDRMRSHLASAEAELQANLDHAAAVAAAPGSEADRLVEAARAAALEIRTRAQVEANDLVKAANDEVRALRADAEQLLIRRAREADELADQRLGEAGVGVRHAHDQAEALLRQTQQRAEASLEAARTRARSLVGEAEEARAAAIADAEAILEAAEARGRELIDEARAVRERMVGDLTRRRAKLRAQVEQLQAGRDRLLDAFGVVREALDEATVELEVVLPEAREAAVDAARQASLTPDPVLDQALARLRANAPRDRDELAVITGEHQRVPVAGDDPTDEAVIDGSSGGEPIDQPSAFDGEPVAPADGQVDAGERWSAGDGDGAGEWGDESDGGVPGDEAAGGSVLLGADEGAAERAPRSALAPDPAQGRWSSAVRIIARPGGDDETGDDAPGGGEPGAGESTDDVAEEGTVGPGTDAAVAGDHERGGDVTPTSDGAGVSGAGDADDANGDAGAATAAEGDEAGASDEITGGPGRHAGADAGTGESDPDGSTGSGPMAAGAGASTSTSGGTTAGAPAAGSAGAGPASTGGARRGSGAGGSIAGAAFGDDGPAPAPGTKLGALIGPADQRGPVAPGDDGGPGADDGDAGPSAPADPVAVVAARRDDALAGPLRQLRRRVKATLVEEENELLHAIRGIDAGVPKAHEVLPTEADHRQRLASAAQPGLLAAVVAGQELGAQLAADETRRRVPGAMPANLLAQPEVDTALVDHLAGVLAVELATELRARLAACFPVGPPTTEDARRTRAAREELSSAVRSAYRSTKAGLVDRVCDRTVVEALNRAVRAQIPTGVNPDGVDVTAVFPTTGS